MTEIGFYHLQREALETALPKLLEKVLARGLRAVVLAGSAERMSALDDRLWTYSREGFLPHGKAGDGFAADQPIYLTTEPENPNGATVLVLVDGVDAEFKDSFARCVDMFDGRDEAAVQAARQRWQAAKAAGHDITYWQQGERGGWTEAG